MRQPKKRNEGVTDCNRHLARKASGNSVKQKMWSPGDRRHISKTRPKGDPEPKSTTPRELNKMKPLTPAPPTLPSPSIPVRPRPVEVREEKVTMPSSRKGTGGGGTNRNGGSTGSSRKVTTAQNGNTGSGVRKGGGGTPRKVTETKRTLNLEGNFDIDPNKKKR